MRSMAASDARGAVPRVAAWRARVVRAATLVFLAVGMAVCCCFLNLPGAAAALSTFLRAAASFAFRHYAFFLANTIVAVLFFAPFLRDDEAFSFSPAAFFGRWWPSDANTQDQCLPLPPPGAPLMLLLPPPPPAATEAAAEEEKEVFEDKMAVHVTTVRAQPPRRSKSEKTPTGGGGAARRRRAAEPELRRAESEIGRQRQRAEPEVPPVELWMDGDGEAFKRRIDSYILKHKTQFQFEESAAAAKAAAAARNGGPVAAAGAVVAVK